MKKFFLGLLALVAFALPAQAQKYGHLNFGNVMIALPATAKADTLLEELKTSLVKIGEVMSNKLKEDYINFLKEQQGGALSPLQQQEKQNALQAQQDAIAKYEEDVRQQLGKKREELLNPILEKVEKAIQEVAKEGGYTMIFDTSKFNALLFAKESEDILPQVKAKLGVK